MCALKPNNRDVKVAHFPSMMSCLQVSLHAIAINVDAEVSRYFDNDLLALKESCKITKCSDKQNSNMN